MLQAIRDKSKGILAGAILIIICVPFAFFGIQNYFSNTIDTAIARVNDQEISAAEFQRGFTRYRSQMQARFGQGFDASYFDQPMIRRQFLDGMISDEIMLQITQSIGMEVPASRIRDEIDKIDAFKVGGQFDQDLYRSLLSMQGMSPKDFELELRRQMLIQEIPASLGSSSLALGGEVARLARLQNQRRSFDYLLLPSSAFEADIVVTDEQVSGFFADNADLYQNPETVRIEYLELESAMLEVESEPDDETLLDRYEAQKLRFVLPERRLASHILIALEANADAEAVKAANNKSVELAQRIAAGESFEALAREFSEDEGSASLGGDLGWVERDMMVTAFEDALFEMEIGDISAPINSSFGFHLIWLRDVEESRGKTFEEARFELAQEYRDSEAERQFLELQDRLLDMTYEDQGSLAAAAEAVGLEILTEGPFSRSGGDGIAAERKVIDAAFSDLVLLERLNSDPIIIGPNHVVFIRVLEHQEKTTRELDEVEGAIRQRLISEQAAERAKARADEMLAELLAGETDLATLATDRESELRHAVNLKRDEAGHDQQLVRAVFKLPRPQPELQNSHVIPLSNGRFAVLTLTAVADSEIGDAQSEDLNEGLKSRLSRAYGGAEISGLTAGLRSRSQVIVAEDKIGQLL